MDDVEEQILSYPHLSAEEQRKVESYVESHPQWAPLLRDVRTLEGLSANLQGELPPDALLATYVVVQHLHPEDVPSSLQDRFSRLRARIQEEDDLREQVEAAQRRMREAESAMDPVSHFEELTGHTLEGEAIAEEDRVGASQSHADESIFSFLDRLLSVPLLVRRGAVALTLLVAVYGGLYAVSVATQSPLDRLAAVDVSDRVLENYTSTETRSAVPEPDTTAVDKQYVQALSLLQSSRTSTLGLFPRYDDSKLAEAERQFEQVLDETPPGSFLSLEAHFYLGKISLAQQEVEAARRHLKTVVKREGRRQQEAYQILKTLQEEGIGQAG